MSFSSYSSGNRNVADMSAPLLPCPPPLSSVLSFYSTSSSSSSSAEFREDGRECCQLRYPIIALDTIKKAESSCRYSQGKTEVIAAVNCVGGGAGGSGGTGTSTGPRTQRPLPDRADIEVYVHPRVGNSGVYEKTLESIICRCMTLCIDVKKYPRIIVHIIIQIINCDGGLESVCTNAAIMAVLSCGLSFNFLPLSVCVGIVTNRKKRKNKQDNSLKILLDPTASEISKLCDNVLLLTMDSKSGGTVSCMEIKGSVSIKEKQWAEILRIGTAAVFTLENTIRNMWKNHMTKLHTLFSDNSYKNDDDD